MAIPSNVEETDESWTPPSLEDESEDELMYDTDSDSLTTEASDQCAETIIEETESKKCIETKTSWVRLPSDESKYSYWQIDIKFHGCDDVTSYMVHRHDIGSKSTYFNSLFNQNGTFVETNSKRSLIIFPEVAPIGIDQTTFEFFLNLLFSSNTQFDCKSIIILPLLYLCDYFGAGDLRKALINQIQESIGGETLGIEWIAEAYSFAERLSMNDLKLEVERFCYNNDREKFPYIWDAMPTIELKRSLFNGLNRLRKNDLKKCGKISREVAIQDESNLARFYYETTGENDILNKHFIRHAIQTDPELIDAPLFIDILLDLSKERFAMGSDFRFHEDDALVYLKHEQRLALDAPNSQNLTFLQEQCVDTFASRKGEPRKEAKCIVNTLMTLKPVITKAFMFATLEKRDDESESDSESSSSSSSSSSSIIDIFSDSSSEWDG